MPERSGVGLCLFAKAPRPGKTKTRLIPALGKKGAALLARAMLLDSLEAWNRADVRLIVFESGAMDQELDAILGCHQRMPQDSGDLGKRMEEALRHALVENEIAVVVGTDIPGLGVDDLRETRRLLKTYDAVLGPAADGGFSLLALRNCPDGLLRDLPWSHESTLGRTQERLQALGLSVGLLPPRFDVDCPEDLSSLAHHLKEYPDSMPHTRGFWSSKDNLAVSVIIPVLNEETNLPSLFLSLDAQEGISEVIVVDGGSVDDTVAIAESSSKVTVLSSPPGRAIQMNTGADHAIGGVLLFLHADVELPSDACAQIRESLSSERELAGAFRLRTRYDKLGKHRPWIRPFLKLADMRSHYTSLPYGDQALFVRAITFRLLGGFPAVPLFEDLALSAALRRLRPLVIAKEPVQVSGRRFQERPLYYLALMNTFPILYRLGVSPEWLARFYHNTR